MQLLAATTASHLALVRSLFEEYAAGTGLDLCFQGFAEELATLPGKYAAPRGGIWLAFENDAAVGCVALRPLDETVCEMKRLYVRDAARGKGVGRMLAEATISEARRIGYTMMRLDTLATMTGALALYRALGFRECAPYYANPLPEVVYLELRLSGDLSR